jgi:hypothetical protein
VGTIRRSLLVRVTDADLYALAQTGLRLLAGDAAGSPTRHSDERSTLDGDDIARYRLGTESIGLAVRDEQYTLDSGGFNNLPNGALLAFAAYGLPAGLELEVRRAVDAAGLERVVVTFTGPDSAAEAFDDAFRRELVRMSRAEVAALEALRRVPNLPETMGFELPASALGWELARVDPRHVEVAIAARDALALVAGDARCVFWLGVVKVKLGDLEGGAEALSTSHAAAPGSPASAVTTARVLVDLGRNREVIALLSPFARTSPPASPIARSELLALACFREGRPDEALSALEGRRGLSRARLLDATGDREGAVREIRHAFLESPEEARRFQDGAVRPRSQLVSGGSTKLGALIDEDWVLAMWGDPRVARMLKANFTRDRRGFLALLDLEDVPPFDHDMDVTEDVAPEAVEAAANTHFALWPRIEVHGVTYIATPLRGTETFVVLSRTGSHVNWEQRVNVQIMQERMRLEVSEDPRRLTLEIDGEHPRGGNSIRERVFFDPTTGEVLGRDGRGL